MPAIELKNISNFICRNISLKIADGELMVLLGPTGAGKTAIPDVLFLSDSFPLPCKRSVH